MIYETDQGAHARAAGGENVLPLRDIIRIIRNRLWIIALVMIVLVGAAVGYSLTRTPVYEASAKVLVGQREDAKGANNLGSDVQGLQQLTRTLAEAASSRPIAEAAIEQLNLRIDPEDLLKQHLRIQQIPDTQFIQVSYRDPSPESAQMGANTVAEVFSEQISEVSPDASAVTATMWEPAALPESPVSPNLPLNVLLALALGTVLGLGLAFLLEYFDDSWHSPEETERISNVPNLGVIPRLKGNREGGGVFRSPRKAELGQTLKKETGAGAALPERSVTILEPNSAEAEAYRSLRTNLFYAFTDEPPGVVVLTSPGPREGKSTTCANLGITLAQANKSTLIMDCDFRRPTMHRFFGLRNMRGVINVLVGEYSLREVCQEPVPGLKVACTGSVPPNPAEVLDTKRFTELLSRARQEFDYVLIDAPPTELVSDPMILANQSDGVLLVLDAQKTRKVSVRRSMRRLEAVGAKVLGTVMNNVKATKDNYYDSNGYLY